MNTVSNLADNIEIAQKSISLMNSQVFKEQLAIASADFSNFSIQATAQENTNLVAIEVNSSTSENSFQVLNYLVENYQSLATATFSQINLTMIEAPILATVAKNPNEAIYYGMGAFLMTLILISLLLGLFLLRRKNTLKTEEAVFETIHLKILSVINREDGGPQKKQKQESRRLIGKQSFKMLATTVLSQQEKNGGKTFLITSTQEKEGKSTISAGLAQALSERHKKVLLVDADLKRPSQALFFPPTTDFSSLQESLDSGELKPNTIVTIHENLDIIFSVRKNEQAEKITNQQSLQQFIKQLESTYDVIIIDSVPINLISDTEYLAQNCDYSLLVVRRDYAPAKEIKQACYLLRSGHNQLLGCVFNDALTQHKFFSQATMSAVVIPNSD